jgi:hypothetical protein
MSGILGKLKFYIINNQDNDDDDDDKINKKDVFSGLSNMINILMGVVFVMSFFYFLYGLMTNNFGIANKAKK